MIRKNAAGLVILISLFLLAASVPSAMANQAEATPVSPADSPIPTPTPEMLLPVAPSSVPQSLEPASDFCLLQDGVLVERFPFVGTNTNTPIRLSGSRWFCEFTGSPEANPPTSRISIGLSTLYANGPTLATLAYLAKPPVPEVEDSSRLAVNYCAYLGGSSQFGADFETGGGWASDTSNPNETSIGICVFPDGSAIDDWGLTYHANDTIRGADLAPLLQFQPGDIPDFVFPQD